MNMTEATFAPMSDDDEAPDDEADDDVRVATFTVDEHGDELEVMVTVWPHGEMEVAYRYKPWHSWSAGAPAVEVAP